MIKKSLIPFALSFFVLMLDFSTIKVGTLFKTTPIVLVLLALISALKKCNFIIKINIRNYFFVFLFVVMVVIGTIRDNHPDHTISLILFKAISLILFSLLFLLTLVQSYKINRFSLIEIIIGMIYIPLLMLTLTNLIVFFVGGSADKVVLESVDGKNYCVMLASLTGFVYPRVHFLFANGFNNYGALMGVLLNFSILGCFLQKSNTKLFIVGIGASIITILLIDTRAAMAFSLILMLFVYFIYRFFKKPRFLLAIPILTVFGSNILLAVLGLLNSPFFAGLSRSTADFSTANSRSFIWFFASLEFLNFKIKHLIGWGEFGHYASGTSKKWAQIFINWVNPQLTTPHSTFYVILFDYGYVGLLLIILIQLILIKTMRFYWNKNKEICLFIISFFFYWTMIGMTESFFGFYANNILYIFIGIIMIVFLMKNNKLNYESKIK